jgi:hypothetical protein
MSILAFLGTPNVTALAVAGNPQERHNFGGEKCNLCLGFRLMKYFSILALLAVVVLAFAGCAATTESYSTGASTEGSAR